MARNIGLTLLGIWLILSNLLPFVHLGISGLSTILALLGLAAGILILIGR